MKRVALPLLLLLLSLGGAGCATHKYVRGEVDSGVSASEERTGSKINDVESQVERNQTQISAANQRIDEHGKQLGELSGTAREALERALAAGKLAEGTLVSETVLSNDKIRFAIDKAALSDEAKAALHEFALPLKEENKGLYIEIQGHTDATGSPEHNLELGEERAEAVRRYLNQEEGFPLHRMSVISYGENSPAADNSTRDGRAKNRRVVLVVLR